jgi:hypothetical protein
VVDTYAANSLTYISTQGGDGSLVERDGETYYKISSYDAMPPFLMVVASGFDHWMFVSSTGGLTCGRKDINSALFPYYTDDKIHDACATTGPLTTFLVTKDAKTMLWKPFNPGVEVYSVSRNLYKNLTGNKVIFEEQNHDLGLSFSYSWANSDQFGFIRNSRLCNTGDQDICVDVLDGLRNILPSGVSSAVQDSKSTLLDAYKQAEAFPKQTAAVFNMSSSLSDRALPSEALQATVVWSGGLDDADLLLSEDQLRAFGSGQPVSAEYLSHGKRGAFLIKSRFELGAGKSKRWHIVADVDCSTSEIVALFKSIDQGVTAAELHNDIEAGSKRLLQLTGNADGCQWSADSLVAGRHLSNTLFNIMRGGTFYDAYEFPVRDFLHFVGVWNKPLQSEFKDLLSSCGSSCSVESLLQKVQKAGDSDMQRLAMEYLPLTFSRRHGDPSRPWNRFSIDIKNPDGSDKLFYQGNWRDIFQNWEALALSYPEFAESLIAKFVNASTADGYNPYRITKDGFDWETLDPEDPWSNIGYWGDHQVTYLQKLIEFSRRHHPGRIAGFLNKEIFVYADVPYRLKGYKSLLADPRNSVSYDQQRAHEIASRVAKLGSDGKLLQSEGVICKVNLIEKLLVMLLAKLGNFVPDGGIWMNTQRPEWNDANNALVGQGLSVVTMCYLRKFLHRFAGFIATDNTESFAISSEVLRHFEGTEQVLVNNTFMLDEVGNSATRKYFVDALQNLGESYRSEIYAGMCGTKAPLEKARLLEFVVLALRFLDKSIAQNRREDGLFHSYNLIRYEQDGISIEHLYEMLEGQVAVLSSGFLDAEASLGLLDALRSSAMYRADQNSYMLYPNRPLPTFMQKNRITPELIKANQWVRDELGSGRTDYIEQDVDGIAHFNSRFKNSNELHEHLSQDAAVSASDAQDLCEIYEQVFQHREFTGRSGAMYKYEGLGCIYWHMVSKLLLATGDIINLVRQSGSGLQQLPALLNHFDDIQAGLGVHKRPADYGAFPIDPYSHTTGFSGVQQPGMTGQVKEDFICRFRELGVSVDDGKISFLPVILKLDEFSTELTNWNFTSGGEEQSEELKPGSMAFTLCGVPVIYRLSDSAGICVCRSEAGIEKIEGSNLPFELSQSVFQRNGLVKKIIVSLPKDSIRE